MIGPRIHLGEGAKQDDWPWHVSIFLPHLNNQNKPQYVCGGSLISKNAVLSSAHCFVSFNILVNVEHISVHAGSDRLNENTASLQIFNASKLVTHPQLNIGSGLMHDIALVKLTNDIVITRYVRPVCLWSAGDDQSQIVGKTGTIVGFGFNEYDQLPGFLQKAELTVVDIWECLASDRPTYGAVLTRDMYCAGGIKGVSACNGDSGGGMFFEREGTWYIRGVISFIPKRTNVHDLCDSTKFTVFTDVAKYHKWVSQSTSLLDEARVESLDQSLDDDHRCQTPTGTKGTCVPLKNCSYVMKISQRLNFTDYDLQYVKSLICGEMKVCCPKFENSACHQDFANRIYLGKETARGELPWAGLLFYESEENQIWPDCGGALVNERYVITTAHCVAKRSDMKLLFVRFNEFNTSSQENCTMINDEEVCRYDYAVEAIIPYPGYGRLVTIWDNIAILRLAEDVTFNNFVKPICLPLEPEVQQLPIVNQNFTVTGWGDTEVGQTDVQRHAVVSGVENEACRSLFKDNDYFLPLTDNELCAGGMNGADAMCGGDGGGALAREAWGDWILVGVGSSGPMLCGDGNIPGVFTNVMKYLNWIEDEIFVKHYW